MAEMSEVTISGLSVVFGSVDRLMDMGDIVDFKTRGSMFSVRFLNAGVFSSA